MPPAVFVGSAPATAGADSFVFLAPAATKARDTVLAIVATASTNGPDIDALTAGAWSQAAELPGADATIWVLRREAQDDDLGDIEIPMLDALAWGLGALVVYRNLDPSAAIVGASAAAIAATTDFACPARVLVAYSDLYLGAVLVTSAATAVTPPAGALERHEQQAGGRALEVYELLLEAPGSTGPRTATTAAAQSGVAASIALSADPVVGVGKVFRFDPVGTIGLPTKGV